MSTVEAHGWRWHALRSPVGSLRAAPIAFVCLAAVAGACSLSLDGDHFRNDADRPAVPDAGLSGAPDARDREDSRPPRADAAPDPDFECAAATGPCKPRCEMDDCVIDCSEADSCEPSCKDATCSIDCTGADHCDRVKCEDGAECLLDCTGAEHCRFEHCDGEVVTCPGDVLACNTACP